MASLQEMSIAKMREFAGCLDEVGFDAAFLEEIINDKSGRVAKAMFVAAEEEWIKSRIKFLSEFELTVPTDYDHATQLTTFRKKHRKEFLNFNCAITDQTFGSTQKLQPGEICTVKIFGITRTLSSNHCLRFLESQGAAFAGPQAASLVYQECKERLLIAGHYYVSFDWRETRGMNAGVHHTVPFLSRNSELFGKDLGTECWSFSLTPFMYPWQPGFCILCFCR